MDKSKPQAKSSGGLLVAIFAINGIFSIIGWFVAFLNAMLLSALGASPLVLMLSIGTGTFSIVTALALLELAFQVRDVRRKLPA